MKRRRPRSSTSSSTSGRRPRRRSRSRRRRRCRGPPFPVPSLDKYCLESSCVDVGDCTTSICKTLAQQQQLRDKSVFDVPVQAQAVQERLAHRTAVQTAVQPRACISAAHTKLQSIPSPSCSAANTAGPLQLLQPLAAALPQGPCRPPRRCWRRPEI